MQTRRLLEREDNMKISKLLSLAALMLMALPNIANAQGSFQGPYVGIQLGAAKGLDKGIEYLNGATDAYRERTEPVGAIFGVNGGYNWLVQPHVLLGIEGDVEHRSQEDHAAQTVNGVYNPNFVAGTSVKTSASLRLRLGYVFEQAGSPALAYLTGGYAGADIHTSMTDRGNYNPPKTVSSKKWLNGWTVGVGYEQFLSQHISGKVEFRFSEYGKRPGPDVNQLWGVLGNYSESYTNYIDYSFRVSAAYHF